MTGQVEAAIIGAGPAGLFAAFQLGLFGISSRIFDAAERPGGQCAELYADKPIYDVPGTRKVLAGDLVAGLLDQLQPMAPQFNLGCLVQRIAPSGDGFSVGTDQGSTEARVVVIATGAGAFRPKLWDLPGMDRFAPETIQYRLAAPETFRGEDVVVIGGGDAALDCVAALQPRARRTTLVHGRPVLSAQPSRADAVRRLWEAGLVDLVAGRIVEPAGEGGRLAALRVATTEGDLWVACTRILPRIGSTTTPAPLADWGLGCEDGLALADTCRFETSAPGIFAIGDAVWYPGKLRLILSAFHEAALMAQAVRRLLRPTERPTLQYTTTSTTLKARLGVAE